MQSTFLMISIFYGKNVLYPEYMYVKWFSDNFPLFNCLPDKVSHGMELPLDKCLPRQLPLLIISWMMYKVVNDLSTDTFAELFTKKRSSSQLRSQTDFKIPRVRTELFGKNALRYLGPVIWNTVPLEIKQVNSLNNFKKSIRKWKPIDCPCRLCKTYVADVGFLNICQH